MGKYLDMVRQNEQPEPDRCKAQVTIEPAVPNARPIYWEQADGRILGPATPEFLAKVGDGPRAPFWIVVTHNDQPRWVRSDRLRSRQQFETQAPVRTVELVQEPR